MNAAVWQQVDHLFQGAVELDPTRRSAFLDNACAGDAYLRSEVESLLAADSFEWNFIETSAIESAAVLLADDEPSLTPGQRIGHYEIHELIGKGGMGEIYLARDLILNRHVALKLLPLEYTENEDRLRRFRREAEAVSALNHPNILTIHELGREDGYQFIATELIEGETLRERIKRGPLSFRETLGIVAQVTNALNAAHRAGIIHRDIKPENIMLREDGYAKVLDFGLAKPARLSDPGRDAGSSDDLSCGIRLGTVRYMSPEQAAGETVDARSDIYSLGVVMYECLTGSPPDGDVDTRKMLPSGAAPITAKALKKDVRARYQTAAEMLADLERIGNSRSHRHSAKWLIAALLLAVAALAAGSLIFAYRWSRPVTSAAATASERGTWEPRASLSSPRSNAEPAVLNGVLYTVGGWNTCTPFGEVAAYEPASNTWRQRAPMLTPRGAHGVAAADGKLYAVGGSVGCGIHIREAEAYDPATDAWRRIAPLPYPLAGHVLAAANGRLFAIGGFDANNVVQNSTLAYDPGTDTWTQKAAMPTARAGAAVVVLSGVIYVIGGQKAGHVSAAVEAYDPSTDTWTSKRSMLDPRTNVAAAEVNGLIYAFGDNHNDRVESYDPEIDAWAEASQMPTRISDFHAATLNGSIFFAGGVEKGAYTANVTAFTPYRPASGTVMCPRLKPVELAPMPSERYLAASGEIDGIIYVVGGHSSDDPVTQFSALNQAYDPAANRWTDKAPIPAPLQTSASAVVDGKFYLIGGNARGYCSNLNQVYDPVFDSWATRAPMPTPRCHLAAAALNGLIYTFGGTNTSGAIKYSSVEIYDPASDRWTTGTPMPTRRQFLAAVVVGERIFALGGWDPGAPEEFLKVVEVYDPRDDSWTSRAAMHTARAAPAVGVVNGSLIAAGGADSSGVVTTGERYDIEKDEWTSLADLPQPRVYSAYTMIKNTMYVIGGLVSLDGERATGSNTALVLEPCSE